MRRGLSHHGANGKARIARAPDELQALLGRNPTPNEEQDAFAVASVVHVPSLAETGGGGEGNFPQSKVRDRR